MFRARILVVDDQADLLAALKLSFEFGGYDVSTAVHGLDALRVLSNDRPDLIVTDLLMPVMDGGELCLQLKAHRATASIPIIVYSALDELPPLLKPCVKAFVRKAAGIGELDQKIRDLLTDGRPCGSRPF